MYIPEYLGARTARSYELQGEYLFELKTDFLQSARSLSAGIWYEHILEISRKVEVFPFAYVTAELACPPEDPLDDFFAELEPEAVDGSHLLCSFEGPRRTQHAASDDWGDLDLFEQAALELAQRIDLAPITDDWRTWRMVAAAEDRISQLIRQADQTGRMEKELIPQFPPSQNRLGAWACNRPTPRLDKSVRQ